MTAGSIRSVGLAPQNIPNPDLRWESTASTNVGLDLALWQNRVSFTADAYYKKTTDLLLEVAVPRTNGFQNILLNAGSVENKGLEFALNTVNVEGEKFSWNSPTLCRPVRILKQARMMAGHRGYYALDLGRLGPLA